MRGAQLITTLAALAVVRSASAADGDPTQGAPIYKSSCASCHGPAGRGDGPIASALTPRPSNFSSEASRQKSEAELLEIIHNGVPNTSMPSYKTSLSEAQVRDVLAYLVTLRTANTDAADTGLAPPAAPAPAQRPPLPGETADAAALYANVCALCHETNIGPALGGRKLHPAYVQYVVRNGLAAMPAFRPSEIDDGTSALLADYVAKLPGPSQ